MELFTCADSKLLYQLAAEIGAFGFLQARDDPKLRGALTMLSDALRFAGQGSELVEAQRDAAYRDL